MPANYPGGVMGLLTDIEQVKVDPDQPAKVVIDEKSGVIVMGADVRISTVAIAQGNLTIRVTETPQVSQPAPFSNTGTTEVVPRTQIQIDDSKGNKMAVLHEGVSLQSLVDGLNALGVGPRDIISILQAIKAAGALQADIQVIGMNAAIDTNVAMAALRPRRSPRRTRPSDPAVAKKAAQEFEGVFITQFLGQMFSGIPTDGPFGGGQGEEMFRSLMVDEYGKQIDSAGRLRPRRLPSSANC